ncbi:hypothetical protein SISNIDRAFT_462149 [Sistotremastrum niveocremeum HHB9708]|uniref:Uncharacterized protein n=2 Tax=Sistotremastraceae TaxID=3402574 RepID=A0A165AN44_9AGAM|nr:hypothetical protein SISNIDRAFT_462149 [Sistotremastrum niveocremeum HHB9708]KZT36987.1 hypothetical protein SISSUDRAFT_1034443 [Sistotremastrum suecicum HHB10207 ss-3]
MPIVEHLRARSPQNQVVTTTIFTGPSQTAPTQSSGTPIPLGAIIGGTVAGATLAVIAVLCWIWWGRSIKRQQQQRRAQLKGQTYARPVITHGRSSTSSRGSASKLPLNPIAPVPPAWATASERRVSFAAAANELTDAHEPASAPPSTPADPLSAKRSPPRDGTGQPATLRKGSGGSPDEPLGKQRRSYQPQRPSPLALSAMNSSSPPPLPNSHPSADLTTHTVPNPSRNGNGRLPISESHLSVPSQSASAPRSAASRGQRAIGEPARTSFLTATSASVYSDNSEPIGLAYGGEDYDDDVPSVNAVPVHR